MKRLPSAPILLALLLGAVVVSLEVRSDAQVANAPIDFVREFETSGLRNVSESELTLIPAQQKRRTFVTDVVVDNRNAFGIIVTFSKSPGSSDLFSVSVPEKTTENLHFQTGFELLPGESFRASSTATARVTANAFRIKE
jgi:hypothetical protein